MHGARRSRCRFRRAEARRTPGLTASRCPGCGGALGPNGAIHRRDHGPKCREPQRDPQPEPRAPNQQSDQMPQPKVRSIRSGVEHLVPHARIRRHRRSWSCEISPARRWPLRPLEHAKHGARLRCCALSSTNDGAASRLDCLDQDTARADPLARVELPFLGSNLVSSGSRVAMIGARVGFPTPAPM
jgi:hypothetical protein